jgi:hypothetical protein
MSETSGTDDATQGVAVRAAAKGAAVRVTTKAAVRAAGRAAAPVLVQATAVRAAQARRAAKPALHSKQRAALGPLSNRVSIPRSNAHTTVSEGE